MAGNLRRAETGIFVRAAGLIGMGLFAWAAVGSATDRLAAVKAPWEVVVPGPLADGAWRSRALLAIRSGQPDAALAAARAAVNSGPVEPGSPELLGSALLLANQPAAADRAFRVAGQMGWRQTATQVYWMNQALGLDDYRVAMMRLDAMLRQTPPLAADAALLAPFENAPAGRTALVATLTGGAPWREAYVNGFADLPLPQFQARAAVVRAISAAGQGLGCAQVGPFVSGLLMRGLAAEADAIWRASCPAEGGGILGGGTFAGLDLSRRDSLFSWWAPADSDVNTVVNDMAAPGQPRLVVSNSASFPREVITRLVYLPAGNYRLSWQAVTPEGRPSDRIEAVVDCRPASGSPLAATLDPRSGRAAAALAADSQCPARWLSFRLRPGTGEVRLGNVRIDRAS